MKRITCSADSLINPIKEDHVHLDIQKEKDIASNLRGLTFLRFQITGGVRSLFGRRKTSPPVWLGVEDAKVLRRELDAFIEEHSQEWSEEDGFPVSDSQHPTEPIPKMGIRRKHKRIPF